MLSVQTVFLTPGWRDWAAQFRQAAVAVEQLVPSKERCWISVGERQMSPNLFVTIERETLTWISTAWSVKESSPGKFTYERTYEGSDPSPAEVIDDIKTILSLPTSK